MGKRIIFNLRFLAAMLAGALLWHFSPAALLAQRSRVAGPIAGNRVRFLGHVHPKAAAENDRGRVAASLQLTSMSLELQPSPTQQTELDKLLADQQDASSSEYHRWLTPEQYADRFGVSAEDLNKISAWLQQQGFVVTGATRGRNFISFRGTAAQAESAFSTELHQYQVDGELHFANATEPSLPADLQPVVRAIRGLHDFRMQARHLRAMAAPEPAGQAAAHATAQGAAQPDYTSSSGRHYLAPNDVATIYDIQPLYSAGIDGTGQKLVVAGQTQINLSDIQLFRSHFNLPANVPQVMLVPNLRNPGTSSNDVAEADLDLELSGAVARNASIIYVYSYDIIDAVHYAIDQDLAPVITMSYGSCEPLTSSSEAKVYQNWAKQANAEGITWVNSSGDNGGADCYGNGTSFDSTLSVDVPASIPEVTATGGTEFSEGTVRYWSATNDANSASALSYIPETSWNDSVQDGSPAASGGGASAIFLKPSWQTGPGVPNDNARDVPDVSLASSADHDGYLVYSGGQQAVYGGTSTAAPTLAGILTLLNHRLVASGVQSDPGVGNANPKLYQLAQTAVGAFHDIVGGSNIVTATCGTRSRGCVAATVGYNAGPGYDQVTGLGSVDAYNLITAWAGGGAAIAKPTPVVTLTSNTSSIQSSGSLIVTAKITSADGGTPTGTITLFAGSASVGSTALAGSGGTATATFNLTGAQLATGADSITAQYSGDAAYSSATASITITVDASSSGPPSITSVVNGASFRQAYAPGMILTIFGSNLAPSTWSAATVPLPNQLAGVSVNIGGAAAPLYYASPTQLNVQIPYEAAAGSAATVVVNNNGQTATSSFLLASSAPAIFVDQNGAPAPSGSGKPGQVLTMFITGAGAVSPSLPTGAAPAGGTSVANLPAPTQSVSVAVANEPATIQFIGEPVGLVGVTQVNYYVPANTPLGVQPLVVTVGTAASPPAKLTVN